MSATTQSHNLPPALSSAVYHTAASRHWQGLGSEPSRSPSKALTHTVSRRYVRHGMLPQLAAFEAVVRLGSATEAADALCMAQPTMSGHLRKLSEALGVRLFDLRGKHLVPTEAAQVLLSTAREVFDSLERCELALRGPLVCND